MSDEDKSPYPKMIHEPQYDLVERVEFLKLSPRRPYPNDSRLGTILRLYMKPIPNRQLAVDQGVYLCQLIALLVHPNNTIYERYKTGEQAHCWIDEEIGVGHPGAVVHLNDKYWGDREIEMGIELAKLLAKRYGWKVEDKRENLLVQIAKAAAEGDEHGEEAK